MGDFSTDAIQNLVNWMAFDVENEKTDMKKAFETDGSIIAKMSTEE